MFDCTPVGVRVRIRTPFLYPDGDVLDIFAGEPSGGVIVLSDLGETLRWLRQNSLSPRRTPKQRRLIDDVLETHGVNLFRGQLMTEARDPSAVASAAIRLAQAAVRVSDLSFTFRSRSVESASDEVRDFLEERGIPFESGVKIAGRSNRIWRVDFMTSLPGRISLVQILTTGSRPMAKQLAERMVAQWVDLSHRQETGSGQKFVTLFDDTLDVWTDEDFQLVELNSPSEVALWSHPDVFAEALAA